MNPNTGSMVNNDQIRVKAEDFPKYDGSTELGKDINFWIRSVEMLGSTYGNFGLAENEYRKIVVRNFVGEAQTKLASAMDNYGHLSSWNDTKKFLRELFGDPTYRDRLFFELNTRIIHPFESLTEYWSFYRYCIESAIRIGGHDEQNARSFRESRINWVLDHLPPTFATELRQRWSECRDRSNLENFGRVLLLESVKSARTADAERELYLFMKSEYFRLRKEKLEILAKKMANQNNWSVYGLLAQPNGVSPANRRQQFSNRTNKQLVLYADSGPRFKDGNRKFKCVCGEFHRYCDCPTPEGKGKCEEIKNRLKTQRLGIHFLADDNECYWLGEQESPVPICLIEDGPEQDFPSAGY
jgi:hypothetical protein